MQVFDSVIVLASVTAAISTRVKVWNGWLRMIQRLSALLLCADGCGQVMGSLASLLCVNLTVAGQVEKTSFVQRAFVVVVNHNRPSSMFVFVCLFVLFVEACLYSDGWSHESCDDVKTHFA